jgi:hypothetical protein
MEHKLNNVRIQAKIWSKLAFIIPVIFVGGSGALYHLNLIGEHNIFLVVLIAWSVIAVSWWFWTMITIMFLVKIMIKNSNDLVDVKTEVKKVRDEIN